MIMAYNTVVAGESDSDTAASLLGNKVHHAHAIHSPRV